mmetsp:Transcript_19512/g.27580  ORF Transcript_19512/g.27580 Transcript_19512/m.27580 type:complete len:646 (+) Transcript_19512:166-2103(+)
MTATNTSYYEQFLLTFSASIRSVGTACTLASVGVYLHRRNFVSNDGKRTLALLSQQVTIPLLLFTKIVYCNQDWSTEECPNIMSRIRDIWVLLFWPAYVVGWGLLVGYACAKASQTPASHVRSVLAACAFGNSTGLPITLLAVIHANFPATTELGQIDPTLFLSVYLLLYPVLQWGVGGWLLAPDEDSNDNDNHNENKVEDEHAPTKEQLQIELHSCDDGSIGSASTTTNNTMENGDHVTTAIATITSSSSSTTASLRRTSLRRNVLNNQQKMNDLYKKSRRGIFETDASLYISTKDLETLGGDVTDDSSDNDNDNQDPQLSKDSPNAPSQEIQEVQEQETAPLVRRDTEKISNGHTSTTTETTPPTTPPTENNYNSINTTTNSCSSGNHKHNNGMIVSSPTNTNTPTIQQEQQHDDDSETTPSLVDIVEKILSRCLQPPVVGAMSGLVVAAFPRLRGIFVDIVNRDSDAPLEWLFDGLYSVGQAAVPVNMIILGCNLSSSAATYTKKKQHDMNQHQQEDKDRRPPGSLSYKTMASIVIGKMIIMPCVGVLSVLLFDYFFWNIPDEVDSAFYLVAMIVFITPTANNVMVMVELSSGGGSSSSSKQQQGSTAKEGIAQVIAWQYAVSPLVLSVTMCLVVGVASRIG